MKATLLIKGTEDDAIKAMDDRMLNIGDGCIISSNARDGNCIVIIADRYLREESIIQRWFCEPGNAPFPAGTLLWYKTETEITRKE